MTDVSRTDRRPLPRAVLYGPVPWRAPRQTPGAATPPEPQPAVPGWVDPDERVAWFEHRPSPQPTASWRQSA